ELELLKKKERLTLEREIAKLNERLGGIRTMTALPDLLFVVDVNNEETAVREANILSVPVIAMVDTNCDPDVIDFVIPANDDAIRAIKLIISKMADAAIEGMAMREEALVDEIRGYEERDYEDFAGYEDDEELTDEALLGEATLAKIRRAAHVEEEE
ncbi:MAG: 30S ribosomal protein S2, partial [Anaerolineae bacterium]|nr:30S ribosomal protein S2 [Anaerolineae bacterium]